MRIDAPFSVASRARARLQLSSLCSRVLVLTLICTIGLISTLALQTAPAAYAASSQAPNLTSGKTYQVTVYLDHTKLHDYDSCPNHPSEFCNIHIYINAGTYQAQCQKLGEHVDDVGYSSDYWMLLQDKGGWWGWVSNVYIVGDAHINGVQDCPASSGSTTSSSNSSHQSTCPSGYICASASTSAGATGDAIFKFTGRNSFTVSSMSVGDTKCNSHEVYITFHEYDQNDNTGLDVDPGNRRHNNDAGCNTGLITWKNASFTENTGVIQSLQIKVCDDGPGNTCQSSTKYTNPYVK